jgi:hypothetical protein
MSQLLNRMIAGRLEDAAQTLRRLQAFAVRSSTARVAEPTAHRETAAQRGRLDRIACGCDAVTQR